MTSETHHTPHLTPDAAGQPILAPQELAQYHFKGLEESLLRILNESATKQSKLIAAERDLNVYKQVYDDLQYRFKELESSKALVEKQRDELEKGSRVITLIDGDGAIFEPELIAQGQTGGHLAAEQLLDSIKRYLAEDGMHEYQLYVYIFLNKRGLSDTFNRHGLLQAKRSFDEFIIGFNQAKERFLMVDVGNAKEAADSKIKAILESEIRLPQTKKIIFGGCHDNGYVTTLRSHITEGHESKFILLPGYAEIAAGIKAFALPHIINSSLFLAEKLTNTPFNDLVTNATGEVPASAPMKAGTPSPQKGTPSPQIQEALPSFSFGFLDLEPSRSNPVGSNLSYSQASMLQGPERQRGLSSPPGLDSGASSASSEDWGDLPLRPAAVRPNLGPKGQRKPDPTLAMSKQVPPPCTKFYLTDFCKFGGECTYSHDYVLQIDQFEEIKENAKKTPCMAINSNNACIHGDNCCFGHKCPNGNTCYFLRQGKCYFKGRDMHKSEQAKEAPKTPPKARRAVIIR
ncbi:hypothetical protein FA13DRAFT_1728438 [Coprinellus micaceus]|uniref:C3H1-type domain-containing protein n=1 Tax=Coprinellus micaceus TaxID=71717 RepID=A0A4Y7TNT0_COPMI|nr:hypothetical protein FA13DRAFT_1728438 [Coprinellus micaceus]